ncbi:hypothetical protein B0H15DRAFT_416574 [Mycena belliarum]|uniref:Uncharacterized protein n=1 Tax=Mycena belliarum TaxID=1033014 RepID=A0AAD6TY50_9AGAR|nr:hypothetical protein B0H15DRAFT_416574 [Mycena belliae]
MPSYFKVYACLCSLLPIGVVATVDFNTCLRQVRNGEWGSIGGTDNTGHRVSNISEATAITYDLCLVACGAGSEPFDWNIFSQQFSAWLLPYLALVSQLPFGANSRLDNIVSMLLTMGSPTLAAYSLALTVLNGHWIAQRFSPLNYPNVRNAVRILSSLQQASFQVTRDEALLASLIVLPENDEWWSELVIWLNFVHTWSISAVASILWVIIAYVFTVVDSFSGVVTYSTLNANGQAVGSIFLWLLPIVVGWLQLSPKCDYDRVQQALKRANTIAYVATPDGKPTPASDISGKRAISLQRGAGEIHRDEQSSAPIYNYARFLPWTLAVEDVYHAFREASDKSETHQPVDSPSEWEKGDRNTRICPQNRRGSLAQVAAYIKPTVEPGTSYAKGRSRWGPGVLSRFLLASFLALFLTWGTVGAAILIAFFTPTKGIACRSGSYLIYGIISTLVWILLATSSALAHYSTFTVSFKGRYMHTKSTRWAGIFAIILRRLGKVLASINAVWIVLACLFQFGSFFDRCWCNSSVFYLGKHAYNVIDVTRDDVAALNEPWIGGVALASGCAILFLGGVNVLINPALPD